MNESTTLLMARIIHDVECLHGTRLAALEIRPGGFHAPGCGSAYGWTARIGRDNWEYKSSGSSIIYAIEDLAAKVSAYRAEAEAEEAAELADDGAEHLVEVERDTIPGMPASARVA